MGKLAAEVLSLLRLRWSSPDDVSTMIRATDLSAVIRAGVAGSFATGEWGTV